MHRATRLLTSAVRSPVLWGSVASIGFYSLHRGGVIAGAQVDRYFAGHPVNYIETVTFFVGLAALVIKALDLVGEWQALGQVSLEPRPEGGQEVDDAPRLAAALDELPGASGSGILAGRLRAALEFVARHRSAAGLEDELKELADADAGTAHASYALVRIVIWAIPILGFLGTVIGITMAIAELSPEALENSLPQVTHGLGVAFDTTALALALSMVLMFLQYGCDRFERRLLNRVQDQALAELGGRFDTFGPGGAAHVAEVRRMSEIVLRTSQQAVERQAQLWQATIEAAQGRWHEAATQTHAQLESALGSALSQALAAHAEAVTRSHRDTEERNRRHWSEVQGALGELTRALVAQQSEMTRQGQVLLEVVSATGQVAQLEAVLNRNLESLAGAQQFEETLHSLAAAVHLLTARLGQPPASAVRVTGQRRGETKAA